MSVCVCMHVCNVGIFDSTMIFDVTNNLILFNLSRTVIVALIHGSQIDNCIRKLSDFIS